MKRVGIGLGLFAFFILVAVAISWPLAPLAPYVATSGFPESDLGYTVFVQWWAGQVTSGQLPFGESNLIYYPDGKDIASYIWNPVLVFATGWLHWFMTPIAAYNTSIILLMGLNGLAFFFFGKRLGGISGGLLSAAVGMGMPFAWSELFDGRLEQGLLAPTVLWFIALLDLRDGKPRAWLWAGLAMALVGACYWFQAPMAAIGALPILGGRLKQKSTWIDLFKAVGVCIVAAAPFMLMVLPHLMRGNVQDTMSDRETSLALQMMQATVPRDWWGWLWGARSRHVARIPVGLSVAVLLMLWRSRDSRKWFLLAVVGAIFALGPALLWNDEPILVGGRMIGLPLLVLDQLPGFGRMWWSYRWMSLAVIAFAAMMALVPARLPDKWRRLGVAGLILAITVEGAFLMPMAEERLEKGHPGVLADFKATQLIDPKRTLLDLPDGGRYYALALPQWFRSEEKREGAMLQFPMRIVGNGYAVALPYHQIPIAAGDGVKESFLRPESFNTRLATNAVLQAWHDNAVMTNSPEIQEGFQDLYDQGFRWVAWHFPDPARFPIANARERENAHSISRVLGPPVSDEGTLRVWKIDESRLGQSQKGQPAGDGQPPPPAL